MMSDLLPEYTKICNKTDIIIQQCISITFVSLDSVNLIVLLNLIFITFDLPLSSTFDFVLLQFTTAVTCFMRSCYTTSSLDMSIKCSTQPIIKTEKTV